MGEMSFTSDELNIIDLFLNKEKSIREISEMYENYGRTRINNILNKYSDTSDENKTQVELRKKSSKYHKEVKNESELNGETFTNEQIKKMYFEIMKREKNLTMLAKETGKNRDTIRKAIIDYLNDDKKIEQFKKLLKENQNLAPNQYFDNFYDIPFDELPENVKKKRIFEKFKSKKRIKGIVPGSDESIEKKYNGLMLFFKERNYISESDKDKITKAELQKMMFDTPNLLCLSISNKVKPVTDMLELAYGRTQTSYILKRNSVILSNAIVRTALQIKILKDTHTSEYVLENPIHFRISPEFMYALIKKWELTGKKGIPFIGTQRLYKLYGETSKSLQAKYDIKDEYGDDEYFIDK